MLLLTFSIKYSTTRRGNICKNKNIKKGTAKAVRWKNGSDEGNFRRPSAKNVEVVIPIGDVISYRGDISDNECNTFREEITNIKKLYESVGWKITYDEDDFEYGNMIFRGEVSPSPYRKLLEGPSGNEFEEGFEQKYAEEAGDDVKLTSPEEIINR